MGQISLFEKIFVCWIFIGNFPGNSIKNRKNNRNLHSWKANSPKTWKASKTLICCVVPFGIWQRNYYCCQIDKSKWLILPSSGMQTVLYVMLDKYQWLQSDKSHMMFDFSSHWMLKIMAISLWQPPQNFNCLYRPVILIQCRANRGASFGKMAHAKYGKPSLNQLEALKDNIDSSLRKCFQLTFETQYRDVLIFAYDNTTYVAETWSPSS